jgi:hypothetical protein
MVLRHPWNGAILIAEFVQVFISLLEVASRECEALGIIRGRACGFFGTDIMVKACMPTRKLSIHYSGVMI